MLKMLMMNSQLFEKRHREFINHENRKSGKSVMMPLANPSSELEFIIDRPYDHYVSFAF